MLRVVITEKQLNKMINALKAFKIESPSLVKGGGAVVTCTDGKVCDLKFADGTYKYDIADAGLKKGDYIPSTN
jgi:hypothetical protein